MNENRLGTLVEDRSLRNQLYVFKDREDAGKLLARRLAPAVPPGAWVLAIPAGGVPVGLQIATVLHLPFDLMIVRKIQIPGNTEAGFGAIGPDGEVIFNEKLLRQLRLSDQEIGEQIEATRRVMVEREHLFRRGRPFPVIKDKPIILVDDGLASGFSMMQALRFAKKRDPKRIIVAVPTAPEQSINRILPFAEEVYCLNIRTHLSFAVAEAYENWYDLTDPEVISLLTNSGNLNK